MQLYDRRYTIMQSIMGMLFSRLFFRGFAELDLQIEKFQRLRDSSNPGSRALSVPGLPMKGQGDATPQ